LVTVNSVALPSSLQWKSPLGGNKILGGVFDGMSLSFQNSTQIFVTCNSSWRVLTGSANNARLNMYGCYRNTSADPPTPAPVIQNDCATLTVVVDGGWFFIDPNSTGVPFFVSTGSADVITLSIRNCVLETVAASGTTNDLLSTVAPNVLADLDPNSVTFTAKHIGANYLVNSQPQGNSAQGKGYGVAHIVADYRQTGLMASAAGATYNPSQDSDLEVSAEVFVVTKGSIATQLIVSYKDEGGTLRTRPIPVIGPASTGFSTTTTPISAVGPWMGATLRIRAQASTAVVVKTDPGGTYTGCSYTFGSTIKLLSTPT
jgi:hypothetical protein